MRHQFDIRISENTLFVFGLVVFVFTGVWNIGIIAMDDYYDFVSHLIPAANHSFESLRTFGGLKAIRSPVPWLLLLPISKLSLALGLDDPVMQFRFILGCGAAFAFFMHAKFGVNHFSKQDYPLHRKIYLIFIGFYFLCPLVLTRAMIESVSAPFVTASCYFATRYYHSKERAWLFSALLFLLIAGMIRYQAGASVVGLLALTLLLRRYKDTFLLCLWGILGFLLIGAIDGALRGSFHVSFLNYYKYNIRYASTYGVSPFYVFILLFTALSFPPLLVSKYKNFRLPEKLRSVWPAFLYWASFVFMHSIVEHKEERFMIPIIPIFLICMVPVAHYFLVELKSKWRIYYFGILNTPLLLLTSLNIAQNNTISLVRYSGETLAIKNFYSLDSSVIMYPSAFMKEPANLINVPALDAIDQSSLSCSDALVVRTHDLTPKDALNAQWKYIKTFSPGLLEGWLVKLNPNQNSRRGPLSLYIPAHCDDVRQPGK